MGVVSVIELLRVLFICVTFSQVYCRSSLELLITGGHEAKPHSAPYIVSLQVNDVHQCGGSIIDEHRILTAAHCVPDAYANQIVINAGRHDLKADKADIIQKRKVNSYKRHKLYIGGVNPYDIALIYTKEPFTWTAYVKPIKLTKSKVIPSGVAYLYGWGSTSTTQTPFFPNKLQTAEMNILKFHECEERLKKLTPDLRLHETCFCTGSIGKSICMSDSGGPLVNKNHELIGIVSWGVKPCGNPPDAPSVFVRVSAFIDWIADTKFQISNSKLKEENRM